MARRIDIELTSARADGTWTWRAAGARQPRGVVDGQLLYAGAKAGDVVRADADFELEGITIVSVNPPREKPAETGTLLLLGPARPDSPAVTTQLVGRNARNRRERPPGAPGQTRRGEGPARPTTPDRRDDDRERSRARRPDGSAPRRGAGPENRERPAGDRTARERPAGDRRRAAGDRGRPGGDRTAGTGTGGRPASQQVPGERSVRDRPESRQRRTSAPDSETRTRTRRLNPGRTHRNAVLASLPPEQQPIAEQVLRGGIPAVRTAIHLEREKAAAEGRPAPNAEGLLAIAENLLPSLKGAEWRDRAEAAVRMIDDLALRDLRSLVAGADMARDDAARQLASTLREGLEQRVDQLRQQWEQEIADHLAGGRVVRAVRLSSRPPDAGCRLPAPLVDQLAAATGAAMAPTTPSDRWVALIETVADSPVRRAVKPVGWPSEPSEELQRVSRQQAGRIPALAELLGISIPLPPGPLRPPPAPPRRGEAGPSRPAPVGVPSGGPDRDQTSAEDRNSRNNSTASDQRGEGEHVVSSQAPTDD